MPVKEGLPQRNTAPSKQGKILPITTTSHHFFLALLVNMLPV
jgi:hypothetical protein